jgi:hypothetical protein
MTLIDRMRSLPPLQNTISLAFGSRPEGPGLESRGRGRCRWAHVSIRCLEFLIPDTHTTQKRLYLIA